MRIRKLPGKRLPGQLGPSLSKAQRPSVFNVPSKNSNDYLPPPPSGHSPHPNSTRYALGLFKYSTGSIDLADAVSSRSGVRSAGYKIYTQQQLLTWVRTRSRGLVGEAFAAPLSWTLESSLHELCAGTSRALSLVEGTADALFQIYPTVSRSRSSTTTKLLPQERMWNLLCQQSRDTRSVSPSKPYVILQTNAVPITRWCRVYLDGVRTKLQLKFALGAHLKPGEQRQACNSDTPRAYRTAASPLQSMVDDMLTHAVQSVATRIFEDVNHALSTVQHGILSFLKKSQLASIVDFNDLEVILFKDVPRERFVSNIYLNADGSERYNPIVSSSTVESHVAISTGYEHRYRILSARAQEKLGIDCLFAKMSTPASESSLSGQSQCPDLLMEFDGLCQNSPYTGLACGTATTALLCRRYPGHDGYFMRQNFESELLSPPRAKGKDIGATIKFKFNMNADLAHVAVRLRTISDVQISVSDPSEAVIKPCDVLITLVGTLSEMADSDTSIQTDYNATTAEEISILERMGSMIVEAVCAEMKFDSYEAAAKAIAETALQVIRFPNPDLKLVKVDASLRPPGSSTSSLLSTHAEATWRGVDERVLKVPALASEKQEIATAAYPDSEQNVKAPPLGTERACFSSKEESKSSAPHVTAHTSAGNKDIEQPGTVLIRHFEPAALFEKTGLAIHELYIRWKEKDANAASQFTAAKMRATIEDLTKSHDSQGLYCLQHIFKHIKSLAPPPKRYVCNLGAPKSHPKETNDEMKTHQALVCRVLSGGASMHCQFTMADVSGMRFALRDRAVESYFRTLLSVSITGTLPNTDQAEQRQKSVSALTFIPETLNAIVRPRLEHNAYDDINALAADVVFILRTRRELFAQVFDVHEIKVTARLNNEKNPAEVITEASGKAAWSKAVSDDAAKTSHDVQLVISEPDAEEPLEGVLRNTSLSSGDNDPSDSNEEDGEDRRTSIESLAALDEENSTTTKIEPLTEGNFRSDGQFQSESVSVSAVGTASNGPVWKERVFIALGSNVGDRIQSIEAACKEMDLDPDIEIRETSSLYETEPMYVEDQDRFLNGACAIRTTLLPIELLDRLQAIENRIGRVKTIDKGPRSIDLDILFYNRWKVDTERLKIPHPLMMEREFVLRPLRDLAMAVAYKPPLPRIYHDSLVDTLDNTFPPEKQSMYPFTPLAPSAAALRSPDPRRSTQIMSILNVTPDSFSDGGDHSSTDLEQLKSFVQSQIASGATIIDVGGQSSRPNAPDVTADEETARVVPAIEAIKSLPKAEKITISVDTYRAAVAEAAVRAGAHVINDISAGMLDPDMLPTIAELGCTYVMMHMRGTPATMQSDENCTYPDGLVPTIGSELAARLRAASDAGIRRWRIILDPGIGFSKTPDQNLELLKNFGRLRAVNHLRNLSWLVGSSRKSFIGKITGVENPKERGWGTAATVTAAIQGGADIVRVHDAGEMADVVTMADAMYRS